MTRADVKRDLALWCLAHLMRLHGRCEALFIRRQWITPPEKRNQDIEPVILQWHTVSSGGRTADYTKGVGLPRRIFYTYGSRMLIVHNDVAQAYRVPSGRYEHVAEEGGRWIYRRAGALES
jgi:hypothetical protein